jgi:hypothetical protein
MAGCTLTGYLVGTSVAIPGDVRLRTPIFSAIFVVSGLVACGGPDPGWIGNSSGGAHDRSMTANNGNGSSGDAGADANNFRDPKAGDGGCNAPNQVCTDSMNNSACTDISSDHDNCGGCGKACVGGDSICVATRCSCTGALIDYCDGMGCMDVSADVNNCGSCGNVCDPNQYNACIQGSCQLVDQ